MVAMIASANFYDLPDHEDRSYRGGKAQMEVLRREWIYIWYYFTVQLEQIFGWWVLGMVIGSAISVFAKDYIHRAFRSLHGKKLARMLSRSPSAAAG